MKKKPVEEANEMQLWDYYVGVLGPAASAHFIPSFLKQHITIAVAKCCGSKISNWTCPLQVSWVSLTHTKGKVHIAVCLFGTGGTSRRFRECQVANFKLFSFTKGVNWVATVNYGSNLEVKFQKKRRLEPWAARQVLKTGLGFTITHLWWRCDASTCRWFHH